MFEGYIIATDNISDENLIKLIVIQVKALLRIISKNKKSNKLDINTLKLVYWVLVWINRRLRNLSAQKFPFPLMIRQGENFSSDGKQREKFGNPEKE